MSLAERFSTLDGLRYSKLERARYCSRLTVPSILPPEGYTEQNQLPQPFSSTASRGVTAMASRMLSALLPLNDMPFFKFDMEAGVEPSVDVRNYLENLSQQVYKKLSGGNLRETIYQALQHLIVVGDVMLIMEDDMNFRVVRLDRYVCRRNVYGDVEEVIYVEYELADSDSDHDLFTDMRDFEDRQGYKKIYVQITKDKEGDGCTVKKENSDGESVGGGYYQVSPYIFLRWSTISGENYGRSHCEDMIGDIKTLEGFTEGLINGIAAASIFWQGVDPTGITELDDISMSPTGSFVSSRPNEVFTISPAATMNPQISSTQQGVEIMRREIGRAFLMDSASMPKGERVTATAVRMIGQELEHVLGGAFSSIARDLMSPIVKRAVFVMSTEEEIDTRIEELFTDDGVLGIAIVTGLQALSRDTDLQKLMQLGEMVRNLPEQAAMMFKWSEYGKALVSAIGFNANNWVKSEQEVMNEQMKMAQAQSDIKSKADAQNIANNRIAEGAMNAAMKDLDETGGRNVQQALNQFGGM